METIKLDERRWLIIMHNCLIYLRNDVFSDEFKKQIFLFDELAKVEYESMKVNILLSIFSFLGNAIFLQWGNPVFGSMPRLKLIFRNRQAVYITPEEQAIESLDLIAGKINIALNNRTWQPNDSL